MLNEGFLQIARMVLGIFIITSLKAICLTCLLGYTGPPFIAYSVLSNQPLNKTSWLPSNNAAVVWSSHALVGDMQDRSAKCLVQVSAGLRSPCPGVLGAAASSIHNSGRCTTVTGEHLWLLLGQMVSSTEQRALVPSLGSIAKSHVKLGCADEIETWIIVC